MDDFILNNRKRSLMTCKDSLQFRLDENCFRDVSLGAYFVSSFNGVYCKCRCQKL